MMGEKRTYGPVPYTITYSLADWLCRQSAVENYSYVISDVKDVNSVKHVVITFKEDATSKQKARIGRTLAWEKMRRIKPKKPKKVASKG